MHSLERIVGVVLVEILRLYVPSVLMPVGASVVHHHVGVVGLYLLRAQREVESVRHEQLRLSREVHVLCPEVLLVGQSRPVEESGFEHDREAHIERVSQRRTHIAHVAHLLGYERAVGEILLVGRAVGVDSERHTHLSDGELHGLPRLQSGVGVEHLYLALVAEVYLSLIIYNR